MGVGVGPPVVVELFCMHPNMKSNEASPVSNSVALIFSNLATTCFLDLQKLVISKQRLALAAAPLQFTFDHVPRRFEDRTLHRDTNVLR